MDPHDLLEGHGAALNVLVRARDPGEAQLRLWRALQLHLDFPRFYEHLQTKVRIFCGDLTASGFGLNRDEYDRLVHTTDSVIHCAASLKIDPVAGPVVDTHFANAAADGSCVAGISLFQAIDANLNAHPGLPIS